MQIAILFNISVLLDVQANLPKTSPFLSAQNGFGEHLFQMFIVLGMYNFAQILAFCNIDIFGVKQSVIKSNKTASAQKSINLKMVASSILYPLENLAEMHPGYKDSVRDLNFRLVIQTNAQSLQWLKFDIKFVADYI